MNFFNPIRHCLLAMTPVVLVFIVPCILSKLLPATAIAYKAIFLHLNDGLLIALILHDTAALLLFRFRLLCHLLGELPLGCLEQGI